MVAILSQPQYDICVAENMESDDQVWVLINSLAPGRFGNNFKSVNSVRMLRIEFMSTSFDIALGWMPRNSFAD